jgi:hypothetical protein
MKWNWNSSLGLLLAGIWFILYGAFYFIHVGSSINTTAIMAVLAIVAGVFIVISR